MNKQTVIDGLLERWDYYKSLVDKYGWEYNWFECANEILCIAMWIDAITTDQYRLLADMLVEEYLGNAE